MRKIIYEDEIKTKVLIPSIPAVIEKYMESVPRTVWDCDFCNTKSGDSMPECLGCGKSACYKCQDGNILEDLCFEVGEAGYGEGYNPVPESDDHRIESFYLCKTCREKPPEKIKMLMRYVTNLEDLWKEEYDLKIVIMSEIERGEKDE